MRTVIYTAVFGNYDNLKQPAPQTEDVDFICFTDRGWPNRIGLWRVVKIKDVAKFRTRVKERFFRILNIGSASNVHPRMKAKFFKILSHRVYPNGRIAPQYMPVDTIPVTYDFSIWVDASLEIQSSMFAADMRRFVGRSGWAMFSHPSRDCIYEEAIVSNSMKKYRGLPIFDQVESYRAIVPPKSGLYACGVIARREPEIERVKIGNELWWKENMKWTYQDQLSLPFVIKTLELAVDRIDGNLRSNKWFRIQRHNRND